MPSPHRTPRPTAVPAVVALVALVVVVLAAPVLAGRSPAAAQPSSTEGTTPVAPQAPPASAGPSASATPLVARIAPDPAAPVPVRVQGFWVDGGAPDRPVVVVRFAEPFAMPTTPWRVSVSAGDPSGARVRSSLVSVGTAGVSGRAERGDGTLWDDLGGVGVSAPGDGSVRLELPVGGLPAGSEVWVEAEATDGGRIVTGSTTWFALQDVLGARSGPSLGVAGVATTDGRSDPPVAIPGTGPTVRAVSRALELTTTDPVPTEVGGVAVTDVVDTVEVARPASDGADPAALGRTDLVLVDRRTGAIQLVPEGGVPVDGVPGTTPWLATGLSPTAPGAPATVTFDLEQLDLALGGPVLDRATTRVGVSRAVTLRDGRVLRTPGVLGTIEWFDDVAFGGTPTPSAAPTGDADGVPVGVLVAVVVAVLVVVVVVVVLVRRRRSGPAGETDLRSVPLVATGSPASTSQRSGLVAGGAAAPEVDTRPDPADPAVASTPPARRAGRPLPPFPSWVAHRRSGRRPAGRVPGRGRRAERPRRPPGRGPGCRVRRRRTGGRRGPRPVGGTRVARRCRR